MNSFEAVGEQTAAIALRLLSGERPEHMGPALGPEGSYVADARQLLRWSLDESRLPAGSVVRFPEPSVWVAYRWQIAAAATAIVLQSLLIAALILQRRQRRIAEVEVQHQRTELAHASRLATLGELSASIAHEVNQPLGAISSNADAVELLLDAEPAKLEDARRVLLDLKRANQRASDVVLRIRELLRKRELAFELYDLNAAAAEIVRLLDTDAMARGVQVLTEFESLPAVRGDRLQFQQMLLNLLMNGMDAMAVTPAGRRHLSVRTLHNEDRDVEIAVADTGGGIDAADMLRLFDSFFTTKKDGMGLGLALCRSIVQAHGGRIWAENSPGGGATFRFVLPVDAEQRVRKVSSRGRGTIDHEQSIAHRAPSR
jgi:signal transduction histidine kinase